MKAFSPAQISPITKAYVLSVPPGSRKGWQTLSKMYNMNSENL
jgi:hypothetical protein